MRGHINKRLESIWSGMKQRCLNPKSPAYKYYGGRGISICREWLRGVDLFSAWAVSHGYADNLTIERKDNNGNYEPSNCCWIPRNDQQKNRRKPQSKRQREWALGRSHKELVAEIMAEHYRLYPEFKSPNDYSI